MRYREVVSKERLSDVLMELLSSEELRALARLTGSRVPTRKAEMAEHINRYLADDGLASALESLTELEQAAVAEVAHSTADVLDPERFVAKYGQQPNADPRDVPYFRRTPTVLDMFLVGSHRLMPREIKRRLQSLVPPPRPANVATREEPPEFQDASAPTRVHLSEQSALRELDAVLRLVDGRKIGVGSKTLRPSKAAVSAVTHVLENGDYYANDLPRAKYYDPNPGPIRAFAWPMILQAAGYADPAGARLVLTDDGRAVLASSDPSAVRRLWERWIYGSEFDELSRIESVKGQKGKAARSITNPADRRSKIQTALSRCPVDQWIDVDEFARFMVASGLRATVTTDPWGLYIGDREYGSLGYVGGEQALTEAYLRAFLLEYAATIGVVDVALLPPTDVTSKFGDLWGADDLAYLSRYDGLAAIRINSLGAYCLGITEEYDSVAVRPEPRLRVLANREIVATAEISAADRLALDQYFESVSDLVWRIDPEKLLSVLERHGTIEQVGEFLKDKSETAVPQTVTQLLRDLAERSDRLVDAGPARIVECDDHALATLIAHDTNTGRYCMLAGSRHLVVPAGTETAFKRGLRKLGFAVRWSVDID